MSETTVIGNGIDAATGGYLIQPVELAELAERIRGTPEAHKRAAAAKTLLSPSVPSADDTHLGLPFDVHPEIVAEAGWGVVFHKDESPEVRAAVMPLFEHRRKRIGNDAIVKVLQDIRPNDDLPSWLARHGVGQGNVVPEKIPFYVLIVGSPERIPFEFGHHLDVEYCVGRLHFDSAAEYAAYVSGVIDYENSSIVRNAREAMFWSPRHALDSATQLSADRLVKPLLDGSPAQGAQPAEDSVLKILKYRTRSCWGPDARKQTLVDALHGANAAKTPAFLFTASHGVGFKATDPMQRERQGALLCQDWPAFHPVEESHQFAAADVSNDAHVHGLVSFHFACFGAGTPQRDQFIHQAGQIPPDLAPQPFLARLPQRLLAHPNGGALACIGHVERAWGYSIAIAGGVQLGPFRNCIGRILGGEPVGFAVKDFNERYAALSVLLASLLQQVGFGVKVPNDQLASAWIERNDAEGYVVLGDPAVTLRVDALQ